MTRTAYKYADEVQPGDILWSNGHGERVVKVERLHASGEGQNYREARVRFTFEDGSNKVSLYWGEVMLVMIPDTAPIKRK
ncbi:MAG TPA: hypothetical protein VN843_34435 [Anaerolineales bacterium]|nr:hypothetical protein [Anaerolineales bacterium]